MKLTVGLLLHLEKCGILERLNQLVMSKIEILSMERIGRALDSFLLSENEDLDVIPSMRYCVMNPPVPETRQAFVLSRQC